MSTTIDKRGNAFIIILRRKRRSRHINNKEILSFRWPRWEELPNFELYMDQVLTILERNAIPFDTGGESATTSTMINNYVKHGILPPPHKKKYHRDHLAVLTIIAICKRVLSLAEIDSFVLLMTENHKLQEVYDLFCTELERALYLTFSKSETEIDTFTSCDVPFFGSDVDPSATAGIALLALVRAVAHKLRLLSVLPPKDSDKEDGPKPT